MRQYNKLIIGLLFIVAIAVATYLFNQYNWQEYLTLASFKEHANHLRDYVDSNYLKSVIMYICTYIGISMLPLPGDTLFNIAGGFLFGAWPATLYINFSMTVAATLMFLIVRYFGKNLFKDSKTRMILWIRKEIQSHGHNYFLMLRLIPLIPISFVNIAAGLTRIPLRTFVWTTSVGLLPISFILAYSGQKIRSINNVHDILSPQIIFLLIILGFVTLSPILFSILFREKTSSGQFEKS
ncbi:MAG TPA: VTT domain-containing protein [Candidatus Babeliales bacterium]|nr:VTT domain-containing protein [Candidatus Babeliales bacterium]